MSFSTYDDDEVIGDAPGFSTGEDDEEVTGPVASIYKTAYSRGVNPDFLVGLAKLETRMGEATIKGDSDSYNLFNIKDFSGKGPRATDKAEGSRDAYRQYASYDDSANDLVDLLERKYPKALEAQTPEQFATALKQGGYATDPDYVNKIVRTINSVRREAQPSQQSTDDAGMPNHVNLRALDAQMDARSAQPEPQKKAPSTERTWREVATDTGRSLTQGAIDVLGVMPGTLYAAATGNYDNALLKTARGMNEIIQEDKSAGIKARQAEMDKKLSNAEGFTEKIVAGFVEGLADPTLLADTLARSVPGMVAGGGLGRVAGTAADAIGMTALKTAAAQPGIISQGLTVASAVPRVAGATAVGTSALVQGSSVASDTYEEAMKRPMEDFRAQPEFAQLAQEHGEEQAKSILAGKAATRAGMAATAASLVAQKALPGGDSIEKMFLPSTMREVAEEVAKVGSSVLSKPVTKGMAGGVASQAAELGLQGTKTGLKEGFSEGLEEGWGAVSKDLEMSRLGKDVNLGESFATAAGQAAAAGVAMGHVAGMRETAATKAEAIAAEGARLREMAAQRQADITKAGSVDEAIKAATDAQDFTSQSIANQILQLEHQETTRRSAPVEELPQATTQPQPTQLETAPTPESVQPGPTFDASSLPILQQERLDNGTQADQAIQAKPQEAPAETSIKTEAAAQAQAAQDAGIRAEVARMREIMDARRQAEQQAALEAMPNTSPAKQVTATSGTPVVEAPVKDLKLSTDVPQFKSDAGSNGVVDKLEGKYDRALAAPIQVWQRTDGSMEVISGRHRLDLAQRSGEQTVPVQIHREADGFTAQHATLLDTELNVKDGRGKVKDYVRYFQSIPVERSEATQRGLLQTAVGRDAYTIANAGSNELIASHNASQLTDQAATQIAQAAPKNGALQAVGMRMVMDGKSITQAVNTMAAVKLMQQERGGDTTGDLFGFDDSSMRDAKAMAKIAGQEQSKVNNTLAAVRGASKRPELAAKEGVNINDQAALSNRIQALEQQKSAWSNWATNPELVAQIRSKMEPQSKQPETRTEAPAKQEQAFDLTPTTPEQIKADEERAASAAKAEAMAKQAAENKAQADAEVDDFRLTGSDRAADVAEAAGQGSLFDAPTIEAAHAHIDSDATLNTLDKAKARAALRKGDIEPGDILPKVQETAPKQEVNDVDLNQGVMFSKDASAPTEPTLTTRQSVRDAIAESLPKQARAVDRMIQRGEEGKRGGMVVIESNTPEAIAKAYSEKTGRDYDAALVQVQKSADGKIQGFHDPQSGLSFVVAPNVTARTAAAVALHEAYHGQQREAIDTKAQALLDSADDKLHTAATRSVLAEARQKITDAGETENRGEAAAYIIEAAAQRGREAGFSAVDGKFMDWVDKHIGVRVGGIIRDFVSMVRAHSLRIGLPINLHVDDLVAYAKIGLERAADGKTVAGDDVRSSFAGRKAATADTNAMQTAQERIKSGDDAETVRNETGWFKGVDGKMRFEINDKDAKMIVKQGDYVDIDAKKNEAGTWGVVKLGALLDHPALFAAYPALKDMDVTLKSYGGGGGHYGTDGSIILNGAIAKRPVATATDGPFPVSKADADAINAEEAKLGDWRLKDKGATLSVLLHEIQHGIQHIEGFASGGNEKLAITLNLDDVTKHSIALNTVNKVAAEYGYTLTNQQKTRLAKQVALFEDANDSVVADIQRDAGLTDLEIANFFRSDPMEVYRRIAGEVESRNVQTRQNLTDEQRREHPPESTADVKADDVIVVFNGKEMHSAPPPANTPPQQQQPATTPPQPTWDYKGSKADKLIYELQDGRIDLKRVQESIKRSGQAINEKFDARLAETLYAGRVATRTDRFLKDDAAPLLEQMARFKVTTDELSDYLLARHAPERNAKIAEVNDDMPDGGAGKNSKGVLMTTQAANDYISNLPTETRLKMEALAQKVDAITKGTRDLLVSEGLEKQETIDAWNAAYKHYAPLFREDVDDGRPHSVGTGFSVRGDASKRATGSDKKVDNMLAHVLMQREAAITRAEKNRVAMSLYGLALSSPNKGFWTTITPTTKKAQIMSELVAMGVDPVVAEQGMEGIPTTRTVDKVTGKVVDRINPLYKSLPGAITVRVNGEDRVLMLNQKDENALRMAENLKNLDGLTKFDLASTIVGKSTRWISAANTQYNPAFGMVNTTRDSLGALVNLSTTPLKGKQLQVFGNMGHATQGIYSALRGDTSGQWAQLYEQFQMDGGQTGYKEMFKDVDARAKAIEKQLASYDKSAISPGKAAHAVLSVLDGFNTIGENVVRLSAYKAALDNGLSRPEAAKLARELTVDFNRKGRMGRELGPLYAFFNASIQGTARTLTSLKGPAGAKIIAGGIGLGMLQAAMLAAAGYDDDEIPDFVKSRNLVVPLGKADKGEKKYFLIPLPAGLNALPNIGRTIAELGRSGGKDFGKKTVSAIGEVIGALNPVGGGTVYTPEGGVDWGGVIKTVTPTILDPVVELATNKGFSGQAIEKTYRDEADNRPGFQRAKEKTQRTPTGQMYLGITKALNRMTGGSDYEAGGVSPSPEKARYLAEAIGGGLLREIEKVVDLSVKVPGQKDTKPSGVPFIGRFYGETDSDAVTQQRYYKSMDKVKSVKSSIDLAKAAGDRSAVERIYKTQPEAKLIDLGNRVQSHLSKLNKLAVSQLNNPENVKSVDEARLKLMRATNQKILEMEAQGH